MTPFRAWLAMRRRDEPRPYADGSSRAFATEYYAQIHSLDVPPQPVLIVADTKENRRMLGMEE